ncbi:MAG: SIS domain-containing protein [Pirellulaceae bacterium]
MDSLTFDRSFIGQLTESIAMKNAMAEDSKLVHLVDQISHACVDTILAGGKILIAGNGGSAADAQHFAGELVSRFYFDRPGLPGIALTTDTSILSAIGNDYGYELAFSRQVQALGRPGDLFVGISTSGNSPNILAALDQARQMQIRTLGMTGRSGGKMLDRCDWCLRIPSDSTPRIQEGHEVVMHAICAFVEQAIFGKSQG